MGVRERREKEREQRRHAILLAARAVFDEHGLEGMSMDRIATEAELAKGTVYLYFKGREELMMGLLAEEMDDLITKLELVERSHSTPQQKLIELVQNFYRFSQENKFFYRAMTQVNLSQLCSAEHEPNDSVVHFRQQNQRMFQTILNIVEGGVAAGAFHLDQPAPYVVMQMMLAIKGAMVVLQNGMMPPIGPVPPTEMLLTDVATLLIRGLESGPTPQTKRQPFTIDDSFTKN